MNTGFRPWGVAFIFLLLSCATRCYGLNWSIWGDDTSTFLEAQSLLDKPFFITKFERNDLQARTVPIGYALQALTFKVFGKSEAGSKAGNAIAGSLAIALCVLLTSSLYGVTNGIVLGVMLLLWPWLIFHSQNARYYGYAFLFTSAALLATGISWRRNSFGWGALAGALSASAISTHVISAIVPAGMLLFLLFEIVVKRGTVQRQALTGYITVGVPLMLCSVALAVWAFGRAVPIAVAAEWGRSSNLQGLVFNLGWSVTLLSLVGWALSWNSEDPTDRMWAMIAVAAVLASIGVPMVMAFRPDYVFPSSLVFFLLASRVLVRIHEALWRDSRVGAVGVVTALLLLPLDSFASYYQDGNRHDYRSAAKFIETHLQPGDLVAADSPGVLGYYLPVPIQTAGRPSSTAARTVATLTKLASQGTRVWYVCRFAREEPAPNVDRWFWRNAIRMLRVKRKRYDYHENILDVYLFNPSAADKKQIDDEVPRDEPFPIEALEPKKS